MVLTIDFDYDSRDAGKKAARVNSGLFRYYPKIDRTYMTGKILTEQRFEATGYAQSNRFFSTS